MNIIFKEQVTDSDNMKIISVIKYLNLWVWKIFVFLVRKICNIVCAPFSKENIFYSINQRLTKARAVNIYINFPVVCNNGIANVANVSSHVVIIKTLIFV